MFYRIDGQCGKGISAEGECPNTIKYKYLMYMLKSKLDLTPVI